MSHRHAATKGFDFGLSVVFLKSRYFDHLCYPTNATLVCVFSNIISAVALFFSGTGISATVTAIGVKVRVVAELFPGQCFYPFGGDIFRGLQMRDQKKGFGWTIFASQTPILLRDAYA